LALYCEVGHLSDVRVIADFCWSEIQRVRKLQSAATLEQNIEAVHCLRFLRDAFGTRVEGVCFREELAHYILRSLNPVEDILHAKIALEASGLLTEADATAVFTDALSASNSWLSDAALRACRNLKAINSDVSSLLIRYLSSIFVLDAYKRADEIAFSLSLSSGFSKLYGYWRFRTIDVKRFFLAALLISFFVSPGAALIALFCAYFSHLLGVRKGGIDETLGRTYASALMIWPVFRLLADKLKGIFAFGRQSHETSSALDNKITQLISRLFDRVAWEWVGSALIFPGPVTHHQKLMLLLHGAAAVALFPTCYWFYHFKINIRLLKLIGSSLLPVVVAIVLRKLFPSAMSLLAAVFLLLSFLLVAVLIASAYTTEQDGYRPGLRITRF
jgi:hypothetical protein